jgi:hypothetical protein
METRELERQNELAGNLLEKLERIKVLWSELPSIDEMEDAAKTAADIADALQRACETYNSGEFPSEVNGFDEVQKTAAALESSLSEASVAFNADDFPSLNDLEELAKEASTFAVAMSEVSGT